MTLHLVIDDRQTASPPVSDLIGHRRFGEVNYRRSALLGWMKRRAIEAGCDRIHVIRSDVDLTHIVEQASLNEYKTLLVPACVWMRDIERGAALIKRLVLASIDARINVGNHAVLYSASGTSLGKLLKGLDQPPLPSLVIMDGDDALVDLDDYRNCLSLLSGAFEVRHFNNIRANEFTISKRSSNVRKIAAEHDYWHLLPQAMRRWFVMPYDLHVEADGAEYRMERLQVADVALQWVHGAVSGPELQQVLSLLGAFLQERPTRPLDIEESRANQRALYLDKLQRRMSELRALPEGRELEKWLATGTSYASFDELVTRYGELYEKVTRRVPPPASLECIGHGDLCFSNMLYERHGRLLKLIDPKGASTEAELWTDPSYDVAKLSHSILGDYDFINQDLYRLEVGQDGRLCLIVNAHAGIDDAKNRFLTWLTDNGHDPLLVRLHELSLFLSMLPLHIDRKHKVLAFLINATDIFHDIEQNYQQRFDTGH